MSNPSDPKADRLRSIFASHGVGTGKVPKAPTKAQILRAADVLADVTEWFDIPGEQRDEIAHVRYILERLAEG